MALLYFLFRDRLRCDMFFIISRSSALILAISGSIYEQTYFGFINFFLIPFLIAFGLFDGLFLHTGVVSMLQQYCLELFRMGSGYIGEWITQRKPLLTGGKKIDVS